MKLCNIDSPTGRKLIPLAAEALRRAEAFFAEHPAGPLPENCVAWILGTAETRGAYGFGEFALVGRSAIGDLRIPDLISDNPLVTAAAPRGCITICAEAGERTLLVQIPVSVR